MKLRVAAVQYHLHTIHSFNEFSQQVKHYIKTAAEFDDEFVLFPELFTTQLLSIGDSDGNPLSIEKLPDFTQQYKTLFTQLAKETNMFIIAGTHIYQKEWNMNEKG